MSAESDIERLPDYHELVNKIAVLSLPISISELHGLICGYLCAGASKKAENYLQALTLTNKKEVAYQEAALAILHTYTVTQQQINNFDFTFQLLIPADNASLASRAQAFSEWCEGFSQGIVLSGVNYEFLEDEDSREALQHIIEFAELDFDSLEASEEDDKAFMDISEYTRMAVLRLSDEFQTLQAVDRQVKH